MKKRYIKIISSCMLVLCMTIALAFTVLHTNASESNQIQYLERTYAVDNTAPETPEGYLFAGWYTQNGETYSAQSNPTIGETYYAKFVPEEVLGIKAQISASILNGEISNKENNAIRLVTSLDSTEYKHIGFNIKKGSGEAYDAETTKKVYKTLYAVGATEATEDTKLTYKANEEFHSASNYFKTWTIGKVPEGAFNTDITVTPYWITLDGTRVDGAISIKTVNLGRSWVYVNDTANGDNAGEFGTYDHPFTSFDNALSAVLLEQNGKVTIQNDSAISVASDFVWEKAKKTRDITIIGESKETSTLSFSSMTKLNINDGVIFDNITLTLPKTVFANGHDFIIQDNVMSENASTSIYGGKEGTNTKGATVTETNVAIYAGSYKEVWGGGKYCTISNDIHVTIKNANIYHSNSNNSRVFGSGANDTVKGDVYVTIGGTFNASHDKLSGFNPSVDHALYSAVHGAGSGTVKGDTYVSIEDEARVDFVYGGGGEYSTVEGTCHVTMKGGKVFSIYGGGKGQDATKGGKNADTSVIVTGGEVYQVMGGNGNGMTGNTYVEIAGGTIHRRIFGGCYNETPLTGTYHVTGYSTVVIKDETYVKGMNEGMTAGSRATTQFSDEIAVLIYNNDSYTNLKNKLLTSYNEYDYLVKANAGGVVSSIGERLRVVPTGENNATVRLDNSTTGELHAYMTSDGFRTLPSLNDSTGKREVYVVFGAEQLDADTLDSYEAKVGGTHFDTLENAITEANTLSESEKMGTSNPVVTLLKDVTIESELLINENSNITVQSEGESKHMITGAVSTKNLFKVNGILKVKKLKLTGGYDAINVYKHTLSVEDVEISSSGRSGLYANGSSVTISGLTVTETTKQALQFDWGTKATISDFDVVGTSGQVAVRIMNGADVTLNDGTINANKYYGIYIDGDSSKVTATDTRIKQCGTSTTALVGVANATSLFTFNQSENGEAYIDGNSNEGRGVDIISGTFILNGGTIRNNKAASGAGVNVQEGATFTMTGGTISGNTATSTTTGGGGVYVAANSTFNMNAPEVEGATAGVIQGNVASKFGAGVLVYGNFNMNAGAISNHGNADSYLSAEGAGVCLIGTSATMVMNGGEISNNYASSAGVGVSMRGGDASYPEFTMNGGEITANHASNNVGGIVVRTGVFTMNEGAVISNNTATKLAGGMSLEGSKTTFVLNGGLFTNNSSGTGGDDIYLAGKITLAKALTSNIKVGPNSYSETKGIATNGGISDEAFEESVKCLAIEDKDGHWFVNDEGVLKKGPIVLQSTGKGYATLSEALEVAAEGDTITILENAEIANTIAITKNLKFTSTTAVSIVANDTMTGDIFSVAEEKTLEIVGASEDAMISITGNAKTVNDINNSGTTNLTNVKVFNGQMGIYISKGSVVASNIEIHNTSKMGVNVQPGASVNITGITVKNTGQQGLYFKGSDGKTATANISNFEVSGTGSASVRLMDYCNVTLTNGTITTTTWGIATGDKIKNNTLNATDVTVYAPQDLISGKKVLSIETVAVGSYDGVTVSVKEQ